MADIVRNGDLGYKQRIDLIKKCLIICNIDLISETQIDSFYHFEILLHGKKIKICAVLKNVVNSGWSDKPFIKRIQVKRFNSSELLKNTSEGCSLFIGLAYTNEAPIFVCWNPFMFLFHTTNRSCYIDVSLLARCQHEGFISTMSSNQKVILSDTNHFDKMIEKYIEFNAVEEL